MMNPLESTSENEEHPDFDNTVAYRLVTHGQWDLLNELATSHPKIEIDLNAGPQNEEHSDYGTTIIYWLAANNQVDLIRKLATPNLKINLNAGARKEQYADYGCTAAYYLGVYGQWDLLNELADKSPAIDLNAAFKKTNKSQTLLNLLICSGQWELIEKFVEKNLESMNVNDANIYLLNLENQDIHNLRFKQLITWIKIRKEEIAINSLITNTIYINKVLPLLESALQHYNILLEQIPNDSLYYQNAQLSKAHLLLQFIPPHCPGIFLRKALQVFSLPHSFSSIGGELKQLKFLYTEAALQAGDKPLVLQLMAGQLQQIATLEKKLADAQNSLIELSDNLSKSNEIPIHAKRKSMDRCDFFPSQKSQKQQKTSKQDNDSMNVIKK
ncbi:MAG: hypothetical protein QM652_03965 [Legionella sp.]|uniref:hypothetical protein n=1 Tax=Legionella sp. TaxID=459 RepID=UPI0039E64C71